MRTNYNPKNNPRVIIIQKLYGKFYNEDNDLDFPKHRFKKFIKDIVLGTIERNDLILDELNIKEVLFSNSIDEFGTLSLKPNFKNLKMKFGDEMQEAHRCRTRRQNHLNL